jgi:hypothetical protein
MASASVPESASARLRIARGRDRQRELYGCLLGDRVRRVTAALGITQARLARTIGVSPAMLSQLASARRVTIGDPAVLARLHLLDQRCAATPPPGRATVDALLDEVARARPLWVPRGAPAPRRPDGRERGAPPGPGSAPAPTAPSTTAPSTTAALRAVAPPARLVAAADTLASAFPELAEVLRRAADPAAEDPRTHHRDPAGSTTGGPRRASGRAW